MLKMLSNLLVGNYNEKVIKRIQPLVVAINGLEPAMQKLSNEELQAKTADFRQRVEAGQKLEELIPEAFAVVREAAVRTIGQRHFDVQLIGGIVLHEGNVAEMKTGEGKTLVATLPLYLNALSGRGAHLVTVNDYLARYHSEWMGRIYRFLGLSVGLVVHGVDTADRSKAYRDDITYGTNNEFGFDYLRDNMVLSAAEMVQRELNYAIVDEVDSILIDEARTPLIISGDAGKSTDLYYQFAKVIPRLVAEEDYTIDEKAHTVAIAETGVAKIEKALNIKNLYDDSNMDLSHHADAALKAHALFHRDRDYVVKDGQVIIVDEFTGRLMFGRRWSDGLHQAVEAKEGVRIEQETQTLATITIQNYFRMYKKLAGMTGTALTEEEEFRKIYGMDVIVIPTNRPMIREDQPDVVYRTEKGKFEAVVEEIGELYEKGQPVLVGTISIERSERLSKMLEKKGIRHQVLNAKHHEREAEIIAQAGRAGQVTIATNMAGRGTDIYLGGNPEFLARQKMRQKGHKDDVIHAVSEKLPPKDPELVGPREEYLGYLEEADRQTEEEHKQVVELGGLHIIGTERHEARRIDNQLRGRSGRQGDPGSSRFYLSLEDDLMRLFGADNMTGILDRLGMDDTMPIEHPLVTRSIETAQKRVESRNFDIRKHVLEYDDVMNKQREVIYEQRRRVLTGGDLKEEILRMLDSLIDGIIDLYVDPKVHPEDWNLAGLIEHVEANLLPGKNFKLEDFEGIDRAELKETILAKATELYEQKEQQVGPETMRDLEKFIMLRVVDQKWMDHLDAMDDLREGINLRAYAQKDPLIEYKIEGFDMFQAMIRSVQEDVVRYIFRVNVVQKPQPQQQRRQLILSGGGAEAGSAAIRKAAAAAGAPTDGPQAAPTGGEGGRQPIVVGKKPGRNDPCPCGSGKKYKKCCGRTD
ncbi:MAG: preprotein translocase subunit SecA [Bacillota bacterium]